MVSSININQRPLVIKKILSSFFDFRADCKYADTPDKKTNSGAQKCVIHRVKKSTPVVEFIFSGLFSCASK
jgi:hypothetical protein